MPGATGDPQSRAEGKAARTILVVEDEVLLRMMTADKLRDAGYTVLEAADSDEALELLAHSLPIELVLSDIEMPGSIDGLGLARIIRSTYPGVKILLTSGRLSLLDSPQHDGFFPKPYDPARLISYIGTLFE